MTPDIITSHLGTIVTIDAVSRHGHRWLAEHVAGGASGHVVAEHRFGPDIIFGAVIAGLRVQDGATGRFARTEH